MKVGGSVTYTSVVAPGFTGPTMPSGSVQFLDGGKPIAACASVRLVAGSQASTAACKVTYKQAGAHRITAKYGGDRSFSGSTSSPAQPVTVSKPSVPVLGTITATMEWSFRYTRSYTKVLALVVQGMPVGGAIRVTCRGRGCPFAKRAIPVTRPKSCRSTKKHRCSAPVTRTIDLTRSFRTRRLHVGARLTVALIRHGLDRQDLHLHRSRRPPAADPDWLSGSRGHAPGRRLLTPRRTRPTRRSRVWEDAGTATEITTVCRCFLKRAVHFTR